MARQVIYTDDLDGSPDAQTIAYSFEGQGYEIDLAEENANKFREVLEPYMKASRRVQASTDTGASTSSRTGTRRRSSGSAAGSRPTRTDLAEIREWARKEFGKDAVADRGRI